MVLFTDCLEQYNTPSLFTVPSSCGYDMHGLMLRPRDFDSTRKYPTVLVVYGGPQVQMVNNTFKGSR